MKNLLTFTVLILSLVPSFARAQYWDWVTDEKSMAAFQEQYLSVNGQIGKMAEYYAWILLTQNEQEKIAEKVRFIHMVRDSLFKSLQQVEGISNSVDEQMIHKIYGEVQEYYSHIRTYADKHEEFKDTWKQYEEHIVKRADDVLKITDMAVRGGDEKNLLDKEQRLFLLNFALIEVKKMREVSKQTYINLQLGDIFIEYPMEKIMRLGDELYQKANAK